MALTLLEYRLLKADRDEAMTLFGGMTEEDDLADAAVVHILGRFHIVGEGRGFCVCRSPTAVELSNWLLNWTSVATIVASPVVDDEGARSILHPDEPFTPKQIPTELNCSVVDGESLFAITYELLDQLSTVPGLEPGQDEPPCRMLGSWHDLASGTGLFICASTSSMSLQTWASLWMHICKFQIRPVITDADLRLLLTSKPDFEAKHQRLMDKMKRLTKPIRGWWG